MDYVKLVKDIVSPLVTNPNDLVIKIEEENNAKVVTVHSNSNDIGKLIGKNGCVATSIREAVSVASKLNDERVFVKFYSEEK